MTKEVFHDETRDAGDLAGVYEFDGTTGYFYLYRVNGDDVSAILDHIHIVNAAPDFGESDISIRWSNDQEKVGFFIRGVLWAAFDARDRRKYGGGYRVDRRPALPPELIREFACVS